MIIESNIKNQKKEFIERETGKIPEDLEEKIFSEAINVNPKRNPKKGLNTTFVSMADIKESDKTIPQFVYHGARSPEIRKMAIKSMTGTSGRQRAKNDIFDNIITSLPPLPEKRGVATILGAIDDKIELNCQMNATHE